MISLAVRNKIGLKRFLPRTLAGTLVLALGCIQHLEADNNSWNKIRYTGGTIQAKVDPYDWNTILTITPDAIVFVFAHRQTLRISPARVVSISYGQEAHRRVGEMVALSVMMINPLALFGLLHKSKDHFIGIQFQGDDGKPAGLLLEADKNNYRAILSALTAVTGKPVEDAPASRTKQ
jgi:hypothetical protein